MNINKRYIVVLCAMVLSAIVAQAQNQQVFISEIMYDSPLNERIATGVDYSNGEYIKISNAYMHPVDLSGWTLSGGGKTERLEIAEGTIIPPKGHILFAYQYKDKNTQQLFTLDQLYPNLISAEPQLQIAYQRKIVLSNAGEPIVLKDTMGLTRDSIYYDGTSNPEKVDRLEATNSHDSPGYECFSLQRIEAYFDARSCAETNNMYWVKDLVRPTGFARSFIAPTWEDDASTPSADQNYIQVRKFTSSNGIHFLDELHYFDGIGRLTEKVQRQVTPQRQDLVYLQEYDLMNRESVSWLPTASIGNGAFLPEEQLKAKASVQYQDQNPYATTLYEDSPVENIVTICGAGQNWYENQKFIHQERLVNDNSLYHCIRFVATAEGIVSAGSYATGQLSVVRLENEDGSLTFEFRDKQGRLVLTRQMCGEEPNDTYHVYDDRRNLAYVLPPLLTDSIGDGLPDDAELMKRYAYIYKYDKRNRCSMKRLPGCDWIINIYDNADKLTFSQDGEQREKGTCHFFLYDQFQRPAVDGYCQMPSEEELASMQRTSISVIPRSAGQSILPIPMDTVLYDTYHYQLLGFQLKQLQAVSCNYYDNYDLLNHVGHNDLLSYEIGEAIFQTRWEWTEYSDRGLLTGRINGALGEEGIASYTFFYYDYEKRPIQVKTVNADGTDFQVEYNQYDFTGNTTCVLSKYWSTIHDAATGALPEVKERYTTTYDHAGRIVERKHRLNNGEEISLCRNEYDELGRLKNSTLRNDKDLRMAYEYNIRSWMNGLQSTHFKQQLFFENSFKPFEDRQQLSYSGNASAMTWQIWSPENNKIQNYSRGYTYSYDDKSQLIEAQYYEGGEREAYETDQGFFSTKYQYDKQGNANYLFRQGLEVGDAECRTIDELELKYIGNQLKTVSDISQTYDRRTEDFKDDVELTTEYRYNKNGSLTADFNRGIVNIEYNYLSLPQLIEIDSEGVTGSIQYGYSADGVKLCAIHSIDSVQGSSIRTITRYVGNKIFENGSLKRILLDGGYVEDGKYYFYLKDYLGNNRVVATQDSITQQMHYYPYGMSFAESVGMDAQPYKFGGKEYDKTAGLNLYDFGARWYQPDLGRFMMIDPMCENTYSLSPYHYCSNNPIGRIDPTGMYDSPIYDIDGRLLGTDDQGLQGDPIIMDRKLFEQGMSHAEAMNFDLGENSLVDDEAKTRFKASTGGLSIRPDYDGKVTLKEANSWYRSGNGPLFVDVSKINLSPVTVKSFENSNSIDKNFVFTSNLDTGLVYGTIRLTLLDRNTGLVHVGRENNNIDTYDFDQKENKKHDFKTFARNMLTYAGEYVAGGDGRPFYIFGYGKAYLPLK